MPENRIHIFLNGELKAPEQISRLIQPTDRLVAVDGGLYSILRLGLTPDLIIGDLDSISPADLLPFQKAGVSILRFPPAKDQTDFELALEEVQKQSPARVFVHAALGGRFDQSLANLALVGADRYADMSILLVDGDDELFFIRSSSKIDGHPGDIISLLPWMGEVQGVTTTHLDYPLKNETLYPDRTRGISNVMNSDQAVVSITHVPEVRVHGRLLCIHTKKS
jgi:thiamine pyrophosphokinase